MEENYNPVPNLMDLSNKMDWDDSHYEDHLFENDPTKCLDAARELKFQIVGNMSEKNLIIKKNLVARLLQILRAPASCVELKMEVAIILNSIAKEGQRHAETLVSAGIIQALWDQLALCEENTESNYLKVLLCCLRSLYRQGCVPIPPSWNYRVLTSLIQYGYSSATNQECVAHILGHGCKTAEQQQQLMDAGAADLAASLLCSPYKKVQVPALHFLAALCYSNEKVSETIKTKVYMSASVPQNILDIVVGMTSRTLPREMQLAAATCLAFLHRADAIPAHDPRIKHKTIHLLVRLCRSDCTVYERVEAAHKLAYLTEVSVDLQKTASLTDHLIAIMMEYVKFTVDPQDFYPDAHEFATPNSPRVYNDVTQWPAMMREAAYLVYASLAANDEAIRKKIIESEGLMIALNNSITRGNSHEPLNALRCLHSLSRSVQSLRTIFQDHMVWEPLMARLKDEVSDEEFVTLASSTLCNLLLEFSPAKECFVDHGVIEYLCQLARTTHPGHRLNAVWALMNMAFQADQKVKSSIMSYLGTDQIFQLLSASDVNILMKTLGLLRNLLSTKKHIDTLMQSHGKEIMQAIIMILEGEHNTEVKEQALCILANIADGETSKVAIMSNEDILKKLLNYMVMPSVKLQIAATFCISNLIWNSEPGALERHNKLRDMGVDKILDSLLATPDSSLFDKVKSAIEQLKASPTWRPGGDQ